MSLLNPQMLGLLAGDSGAEPKSPGLLGSDIQQLMQGGGLLGRFQPNPNESWSEKLFGTNDPRDPRGSAMMAFSLGLMRGGRNGGFAQGLEAYNRAFAEHEDRMVRRAADNLLLGKSALEIQSMLNGARREQSIQAGLKRLQEGEQAEQTRAAVVPMLDRQPTDQFGTAGVGGVPLFSMNGAATTGAQPAATYMPPQPQGVMRGAMPPQAAALTVGDQPRGQFGPSRGNYGQGLSNRFMKQAEVYAVNGDFGTANKLYEQAAKWLPEVHKIEVAMHQGQPVNVITMKDGNQVLSPFAPTPKVHWADNGGNIIPMDEYSMKPLGSIRKTMTPGEVASNQVAQGNLAMRQREFANTVNQQGKPTFHEGQWVYPPSQQNPQGVAIAPTGMPPKPLTEFQGKSTNYAARMQDASKIIGELEAQKDGPPSPAQVAQAGYRAEFPAWMPGGQIAGGIATGLNNTFNPMVTDGAQRYRQAQENWVAAALRQESGAAIGKEEMDKYIRTFFPQPGDSDAVKAQKSAARKVSERAMLTQAGPGAQQIPNILDGGGGSTSSGAPDWKYVNGKLVKVK